jgi:hypothetical protein
MFYDGINSALEVGLMTQSANLIFIESLFLA